MHTAFTPFIVLTNSRAAVVLGAARLVCLPKCHCTRNGYQSIRTTHSYKLPRCVGWSARTTPHTTRTVPTP